MNSSAEFLDLIARLEPNERSKLFESLTASELQLFVSLFTAELNERISKLPRKPETANTHRLLGRSGIPE
jgi:hypothetical protein